MSLFNELKRRNVFRVAIAYIVMAWLLMQVADVILNNIEAPGWVFRVILLVIGIGFLLALFFAWAFELTPDGLKRDADVTPEQSIAPQTARRMERIILALFALALVFFAIDKFVLAPERESSLVAEAVKDSQDVTPVISDKSIAVLPFRNRSVLEEDAFFAEGIHDDLLTQLSKVASLRVISRTSMMRYADTTKSIPEIAKELGAAVVLEGAVQRAGDKVRVNVQLIDGASDVHLWAENYDRALTTETIFAIQADIAQAVASATQVVLSPEETSALQAGSTQNLQAYEAFLRGKLLSRTNSISTKSSQLAIAAFDRAIALDPEFADAYARKAQIQLLSYWLAVGSSTLREDSLESLLQAQRLAPDSIETLMAEVYEYYYGQLDYARADSTLNKILARVPNNAEAWGASAYVARRDGRFDDAIAALERSLAINPLDVDIINSMVEMLIMVTGDFDEAATMLQRAKQLGGDTRSREIWLHEAQGDPEAAWAAVDGPLTSFIRTPARIAMDTRDPQRIAYALSPAIWPEEQRGPGDYPEAYAMIQAEALLVTGQQAEADQLLAEINTRMQQRSNPYPSRWLGNAYYQPCDLPGMMGDLEGVRAAEADFLSSGRRDAWGARGVHRSLAIAFARAGDPERSLYYLELLVDNFGPHAYPVLSIKPGLDSVRTHPRYLALEKRYEVWKKQQEAD